MSTEPTAPRDNGMTFTEHLEELRRRLFFILYAIGGCTALAYAFREFLFSLLLHPLLAAWQAAELGVPQIHFASPIEPFMTYLKTALLAGILLSTPVAFYQLWQFIAPGLYRREKRFVIPFTLGSALCFVGGGCFGYFIVFPLGFRFFLSFARLEASAQHTVGGLFTLPAGEAFIIQPTLMMSEYFGFAWRLLIAFGLVFELPLIVAFLSLAGLVSPKTLWRWNRYFVVTAVVIGGFLTPPDVISQLLMAAPLVILYNASILISHLITRRRTP